MNKHLYNCKMIFMATASIEIEKCKPIFLKNFDELSQKKFYGPYLQYGALSVVLM